MILQVSTTKRDSEKRLNAEARWLQAHTDDIENIVGVLKPGDRITIEVIVHEEMPSINWDDDERL